MVPRITSKGRSFKGAGAYFLHDLGQAKTAERVAFTHTVNMLTDDPEKAIAVMAWTAAHAQDLKEISGQKMTGRKAENPVYNYVLSWAPDQDPDQAHMLAFGERSLKALGLADHEALFVAHNDTDHKHLHVIANRVHPVTGLMAKMDHDQNRLSRLAQEYEEETGQIYCQARVANNHRRDRGEQHVKDDRSTRLIDTPEYQARRAERLQAQRQAAALHLAKAREQDNRATAARDLKAAFDGAGVRDDLQYRAKDITRPEAEERRQAGQAWADEQAKERERAKTDRDTKAHALKEQARRRWLDEKRSAEWETYAAEKWSAFYDRQTERREDFREHQAEQRSRFEERLLRKYDPDAAVLDRQAKTLTADIERKGARAILAKITGQTADKTARLDALQRAKANLDAQSDRERQAYEAKQRTQREEQAKRQETERQRFAERLTATKARQDARFAERETARVERLREAEKLRRNFSDASRDRQTDAQRVAARAAIDEKAREREVRVLAAPFRRRSRDKDRDYER